jgi:hypothetical protein
VAGMFLNFDFKWLSRNIQIALLPGKWLANFLIFVFGRRKYSDSLFVENAAGKIKNFDFNKSSRPEKIQIVLLDRKRLTNL